ncbi:MAG: hypothetical protein AAF693_12850 [Bacteroidota bacterium]
MNKIVNWLKSPIGIALVCTPIGGVLTIYLHSFISGKTFLTTLNHLKTLVISLFAAKIPVWVIVIGFGVGFLLVKIKGKTKGKRRSDFMILKDRIERFNEKEYDNTRRTWSYNWNGSECEVAELNSYCPLCGSLMTYRLTDPFSLSRSGYQCVRYREHFFETNRSPREIIMIINDDINRLVRNFELEKRATQTKK